MGDLEAQTVWSTNPTDSNLATGANWVGGVAPSNATTWAFSNSTITLLNNNFAPPWTNTGMIFYAGASAFTFNGANTLTLSTAPYITNQSTAAQTFNIPTKVSSSGNLKAGYGGGNLIFNGNITFGGFGMTIVSNTVTSAANGGNVISAGQVVYNGSNAFAGNNITDNGFLVLGNQYALGTGVTSAGTVTLGGIGAVLNFAIDTALANTALVISNTPSQGNFGTIILNRATRGAGITNTINSIYMGAQAGLRVMGGGNSTSPGTLLVTNAITVTNTTSGKLTAIVANGANLVFNTFSLGSTNANVTNNIYLDGTSTGNRILGAMTNTITGGTTTNFMAFTKAGLGTWSLSGASTYTTNTILEAGTLAIDFSVATNQLFAGSPASPVSNILPSGNNVLAQAGTLSFIGAAGVNNTQALGFLGSNSGVVSGAVDVNVNGGAGGTMAVTIANLTSGAALGSINFNIGASGTVTDSGGAANSLLRAGVYYYAIYNGNNFAVLDANKNVVGATSQLTQITAASTTVNTGYINGSLTNANLTNYLVRISNTADSDFFNLGGGTLTMSAGASDQILYSGGQNGPYMITTTTQAADG